MVVYLLLLNLVHNTNEELTFVPTKNSGRNYNELFYNLRGVFAAVITQETSKLST